MIKDFTDEVFKKKLQQREKARQKKTEIRQVLEMYQAVTIDLFQSLMQHKDPASTMREFAQLREHTNEELRKVSKRYTNCSVPLIREDYSLY
jgi:16S rRNA C1402 N4-methylase RsmH